MKAVRYAAYGGPEVLRLVEVDKPHAGPGQVRIAVRAAGVNGIDWKIRSGMLGAGPLPAGSGIDAAGVIDEVGDGVDGVAIGDAVFGSGSHTYAEYAVLSSWAAKPSGLSFDEAAGYPVPAETAIRILRQVGIKNGETLLVSGASGGVGSAVVQIARERGITVIGTAGPSNQDYLRSLGAIGVVYGDGLAGRARAVAPDGIDAALDIAGSGVIPELIELTGDPSRVLSIADFSAPEHGAQVSSTSVGTAAALAEVARLFREGAFGIPVSRAFPLAEAGQAQQASAAGHATGRVILTVS